MAFKKGTSGNPSGRPKGSKNSFTLESLNSAIEKIEKEKRITVLEHFVRRAYESDKVLTVLVNKMLPNIENTVERPWDMEEIQATFGNLGWKFYDDLTIEKIKDMKKYILP